MVTQDQRRRQLAREKFERQQQRRAAARRKATHAQRGDRVRRSPWCVAGGAAYALPAGFDGDDKKDDGAGPAPSRSKAPDPCDKPAAGKRCKTLARASRR